MLKHLIRLELLTYFKAPAERIKPWGTGHAVLSCLGAVKEPFVVINADDYYGKEAFVSIHEFLVKAAEKGSKGEYCMAGFVMGNTLSDNGGVTRGISKTDENGYLTQVDETSNIVKTADGAAADGRVLDPESYVSMNFWGLTPEFIDKLEEGFCQFFRSIEGREEKAEYLLPIYIDELLKKGEVSVKVLETRDKWFGVTYAADKEYVKESIRALIKNGVYAEDLWSGLRK